ncbi:hypothetical protein BaRGS_00001344, partial [Batillaria attramentaria]
KPPLPAQRPAHCLRRFAINFSFNIYPLVNESGGSAPRSHHARLARGVKQASKMSLKGRETRK